MTYGPEDINGYSRGDASYIDMRHAILSDAISTHRLPAEMANIITQSPDPLVFMSVRGVPLGIELPDGAEAETIVIFQITGAAALVGQLMDCYEAAGSGPAFTSAIDQARMAARDAGVGKMVPTVIPQQRPDADDV